MTKTRKNPEYVNDKIEPRGMPYILHAPSYCLTVLLIVALPVPNPRHGLGSASITEHMSVFVPAENYQGTILFQSLPIQHLKHLVNSRMQ